MGLLGGSSTGLLAGGVSIPPEILFACDIQRAKKTQDGTGGTEYDFDHPIPIAQGIMCAIQSASGRDIELFAQRDVQVSHKVYTTTNPSALLGDRIVDYRYTPPKYMIVQTVEDMAGAGGIWGIYCWLQA